MRKANANGLGPHERAEPAAGRKKPPDPPPVAFGDPDTVGAPGKGLVIRPRRVPFSGAGILARQRGRSPRAARRRGSAAVELVILLPVLLLIIFAMMYLGWLSLHKERMHFGGEYAMDASGDQSEAGPARGTVTEQFYADTDGDLALTESAASPADVPEPGEVREMFEDMSEIIYSTVATGQYKLVGDEIQFVVTTRSSRGLSADGQYVQAHRLLDDHIPELTTEELQDWIERHRVEMTHLYHPDYIDIEEWALDEVELNTQFQSMVRDTKRREVTNPAGGDSHQIDTLTGHTQMRSSGELPHYPNFGGDEQFWEPN